ncbi:hypothetical protein CEUSTIGMA_g4063.t1 [Chlamydomonas eustigma]|uniref:Uncharacterized protein n=1 Tax=Chlamydomonas eustigma TaxID=1157962 RepID=A0A250X0M0_9CHLO|nr:hypothetical protein CEUSTIGMA_g4063.t1 [Chlamydomonas eustigma]|eukprot:GAX76617.1 hypothetical protein CEUSTIGMA_g4063.t1 [Chlamydomonas eustigma]
MESVFQHVQDSSITGSDSFSKWMRPSICVNIPENVDYISEGVTFSSDAWHLKSPKMLQQAHVKQKPRKEKSDRILSPQQFSTSSSISSGHQRPLLMRASTGNSMLASPRFSMARASTGNFSPVLPPTSEMFSQGVQPFSQPNLSSYHPLSMGPLVPIRRGLSRGGSLAPDSNIPHLADTFFTPLIPNAPSPRNPASHTLTRSYSQALASAMIQDAAKLMASSPRLARAEEMYRQLQPSFQKIDEEPPDLPSHLKFLLVGMYYMCFWIILICIALIVLYLPYIIHLFSLLGPRSSQALEIMMGANNSSATADVTASGLTVPECHSLLYCKGLDSTLMLLHERRDPLSWILRVEHQWSIAEGSDSHLASERSEKCGHGALGSLLLQTWRQREMQQLCLHAAVSTPSSQLGSSQTLDPIVWVIRHPLFFTLSQHSRGDNNDPGSHDKVKEGYAVQGSTQHVASWWESKVIQSFHVAVDWDVLNSNEGVGNSPASHVPTGNAIPQHAVPEYLKCGQHHEGRSDAWVVQHASLQDAAGRYLSEGEESDDQQASSHDTKAGGNEFYLRACSNQADNSEAVTSSAAPHYSQQLQVLHPVLLLHLVPGDNTDHHSHKYAATSDHDDMEVHYQQLFQDILHVFTTLTILNSTSVKDKGIQIAVSSRLRIKGQAMEVWKRVSHPFPVRFLDVDPYPPSTCFHHLLVVPLAPLVGSNTLLPDAGFQSDANRSHQPSEAKDDDEGLHVQSVHDVEALKSCRSSLIISSAHWLRAMFPDLSAASPQRTTANVLHQSHLPAEPQVQLPIKSTGGLNLTTHLVLWISRRNQDVIMSKHMTSWQHARTFDNEDQLQLVLHQTVLDWNNDACFRTGQGIKASSLIEGQRIDAHGDSDGIGGRKSCRSKPVVFNFQAVELSDVPAYPDQILMLSKAKIIVSAYSSDLSNMFWMSPESGGVLEIKHKSLSRGDDNGHIKHLSNVLGHEYLLLESIGEEANLKEVSTALRTLMDVTA